MPFVSTVLRQGLPVLGGIIGGLLGESFEIGDASQRQGQTAPSVLQPFPNVRLPGGALPLGRGQVGQGTVLAPGMNGVTDCSRPFSAVGCGTGVRAKAEVHALTNPISGKLQWFGPGRVRFIPNKSGRRRARSCRPR